MNKLYLVTFDGFPEDKEAMLSFLDARPEIADWHSSMSNAVFVETARDVAELLNLLRQGPTSGFIAVEIRPADYHKSVGGWLPRATWDFIERKSVAG